MALKPPTPVPPVRLPCGAMTPTPQDWFDGLSPAVKEELLATVGGPVPNHLMANLVHSGTPMVSDAHWPASQPGPSGMFLSRSLALYLTAVRTAQDLDKVALLTVSDPPVTINPIDDGPRQKMILITVRRHGADDIVHSVYSDGDQPVDVETLDRGAREAGYIRLGA